MGSRRAGRGKLDGYTGPFVKFCNFGSLFEWGVKKTMPSYQPDMLSLLHPRAIEWPGHGKALWFVKEK